MTSMVVTPSATSSPKSCHRTTELGWLNTTMIQVVFKAALMWVAVHSTDTRNTNGSQ